MRSLKHGTLTLMAGLLVATLAHAEPAPHGPVPSIALLEAKQATAPGWPSG